MTFESVEASVQDGAPLELYRFIYGGVRLLFTSGDTEIEYLGEMYTPVAIRRDAIASTSDANQGGTLIQFGGVQELISLFRDEPPGEVVSLTIFRHQRNAPGEFRAVWFGEIHGATLEGNEFRLQANSALQSEKRLAVSMKWQKSCPYSLYDAATCRVNRNAYATAGIATAINGKLVTASAFSTAPNLVGGYLEYFDPVSNVKSRRTILSHAGGTVAVVSTPRNLAVGHEVTAYPGCDHTIGANGCAKFNNILNYGGCPAIPLVNPTDPNNIPF